MISVSFITAFKKTPDFQSGDKHSLTALELNTGMSSSFEDTPLFRSGENVIDLASKYTFFL